jgi:uncharacterized protein involved in response to NO
MTTTFSTLTAAPHRTMFFAGMAGLLAVSLWWALHLLARYTGTPLWALQLQFAPIWAHAFPLLFTVLPSFIFGFLFTTFPRWMNGPEVPRGAYLLAAPSLLGATLLWLVAVQFDTRLGLVAVGLAALGLLVGLVALLRVLIDAQSVVSHAVVAAIALTVGLVATLGFGWGLAASEDAALHFAVRAGLWGFLLPLFFAVCHRMVPFFSQGPIPGYVAWRPLWVLVAVVALCWARLLLGAAGELRPLPVLDAALTLLTALCAWRWIDRRARGTPLLWTLYVGVAWLPVAMLLQTVRDTSFLVTGEWLLGRAPVHALTMGFFTSLLVAMVTRVTMGHSGRRLSMDRLTLGVFVVLQFAALARVCSELAHGPRVIVVAMLAAMSLWLLAIAVWTGKYAPIYLAPRADGRPG